MQRITPLKNTPIYRSAKNKTRQNSSSSRNPSLLEICELKSQDLMNRKFQKLKSQLPITCRSTIATTATLRLMTFLLGVISAEERILVSADLRQWWSGKIWRNRLSRRENPPSLLISTQCTRRSCTCPTSSTRLTAGSSIATTTVFSTGSSSSLATRRSSALLLSKKKQRRFQRGKSSR